MSLKDLPTQAEVEAGRRGKSFFKKGKAEAQLERLSEKKQADDEDARKLAAWSAEVRKLDNYTDRYDGRAVVSTTQAVPRRGEAHHIAPRADLAVRYDIRNGITLALETHLKVEAGRLRIIGSRFFYVGAKRYINGRFPVRFEVVKNGTNASGS